MSEVSCSPISGPALNRELLNRSCKGPYNLISENAFVKSELENKDVIYLKKTVNRLEQNIHFMQHEHCEMLAGLQRQIDKLREENQDLQFQLIIRSSDRGKDPDNKDAAKPKEFEFAKSKLLSDHILFLKRALEDEKRKNKELLDQLDSIKNKDLNVPMGDNSIEEKSGVPVTNDEGVLISPDIRISLNPLVVSTYQRDSGLYLTKEPLTIQDCEMVIETLLKKMESNSDMSDPTAITTCFDSNPRLKTVPGIKKPLQPIKPISRGSTNLKLNQLNGSQCSNPVRISSAQKLMPIIPHKQETKLEQGTQTVGASRPDREPKSVSISNSYKETKTGSSLPALPKPNDYNQADKQRRLNILQRKRLDQYNNRS